MKTTTVKAPVPLWLLLDAEGLTLGRVATRVAHVLRGKHRATFSPHQPCGDHVIIINAEKLAMSIAKGRRKTYYDHTGYPGSMTSKTLGKKFADSPEDLLSDAVSGMLPKNRLRPVLLKRLHVVKGPAHKYAAQKPVPFNHDVL